MKEIRGYASGVVRAPAQECFSLLAGVDRYGSWNGELVREVCVLERGADDVPARLSVVIEVAKSPLARRLELTVAVSAEAPEAVHITRIPNEPSDREELDLVWRVQPERSGAGTVIELRFAAMASFLPRFMPLGGIGDVIARKLVESATDVLGGIP